MESGVVTCPRDLFSMLPYIIFFYDLTTHLYIFLVQVNLFYMLPALEQNGF